VAAANARPPGLEACADESAPAEVRAFLIRASVDEASYERYSVTNRLWPDNGRATSERLERRMRQAKALPNSCATPARRAHGFSLVVLLTGHGHRGKSLALHCRRYSRVRPALLRYGPRLTRT
jgi:hypothetical protein